MKSLARNIVVDLNVRFGKPTIRGTRITVEETLGWLASGLDYDTINAEYGLTPAQIQAAVAYAHSFLKDESMDLIGRQTSRA